VRVWQRVAAKEDVVIATEIGTANPVYGERL
jgi:hypothetical protein